MKASVRTGAAVGAGVAGGLALAALLLPQLASTVNPTKLGTALLTIALALATTLGQQLNERRKQRRDLEASLRAWPPHRLRAAELGTLGVYPAREHGGKPAAYQARPREEDAKLRAALGRSKVVVVAGPEGAGKSRAAAEAARRALDDVPAIIPLDAGALRSLADGTVKLDLREPRLCLWLDALDRFVEALDPLRLKALEGLAGDVRIVSTIRGDKWQGLVAGSGEETESARTLADRAELVELGRREPGGDGVAEQPGSDGAPLRGLPPLWRSGWIVGLAAGLLATVVAMVLVDRAGNLREPRPLDDQMDAVKSSLLRGDKGGRRHVVLDVRARLHSTESDSWLLVVEDRPSSYDFYHEAANGLGSPPPRSDELRIYDVSDGRLRLKLRFRPRGRGKSAVQWRQLGESVPVAADYDADGSNEVIAGWAIPSQATSALVPFAIDWEEDRYRLLPLTPKRPELSTRGLDTKALRFRREAYQQPRTFRNAATERRFRKLVVSGYRVQAFALAEAPRRRLLTGYFSEYPVADQPHRLEVHANQIPDGSLTLKPCTPTYYACRAPNDEYDVVVPTDRSEAGALFQAWKSIGDKWVEPIHISAR